MSIALDLFCLMVLLMIPVAVLLLSALSGVGGACVLIPQGIFAMAPILGHS